MPNALQVTFLDNIDSFTYNLVDEFAKRGALVRVFRNDGPVAPIVARATAHGPRLLVISPGPGAPAGAGCCLDLIRATIGRVPTLGVCLGHQALVEALGGTISRATPYHGKATSIAHDGGAPFDGLPSPMPVGRYHSLAATRVPPDLAVAAEGDGVVMAVRHRSAAAIGVQFHPESVLTPGGGRLIDNVIRWAIDASG